MVLYVAVAVRHSSWSNLCLPPRKITSLQVSVQVGFATTDSSALKTIDVIFDLIFITDIGFNFRTAYLEVGCLALLYIRDFSSKFLAAL